MKTLNNVEKSQMFHQLIKALEHSDVIAVSARLLDWYKAKLYTGQEHEDITQMYFRRVHFAMWTWMGKNASYFKQNKGHEKFINDFISKEIFKAKIETYENRMKLYHIWLSGEKSIKVKTDLLCMLFKQYPNANYNKEVRIALDLVICKENTNISKLAKEQKELVNVG